MKTLFSFAASMLAVPALAAPPANHFETRRDGIVYNYTVTDRGGYRRIEGRDSRGLRFRLLVAGRHVTGHYGFDDVSFDMPAPTPEIRARVGILTSAE